MTVQNSVKIRGELHSGGNLAQASEKNFGAGHVCAWREVLRVARIANDGVGRDPAQQERGGSQTRRTNHEVSLCGELLATCEHFHINSISFEFRGEPAKSLHVSCLQLHAPHERCQAAGAAGTNISCCADDEQRCTLEVSTFERAHLLDALNDERNCQGIACGEGRIASFGKLIEVAFEQYGTESA